MTPESSLEFVHRFVASPSGKGPTLVLLHGTGGDENDLIPVGKSLLPEAALLSPRGRVLENGAPRFFRRFAEGVFDLDDLKLQTGALAGFVRAASVKYGLDAAQLIAVGYSNGANIAASVILAEPDVFAGAILFRAMPAFVPDASPDLRNVPLLLTAGERDPIVKPEQTVALAKIFENAGARVSIHWHHGGHELGRDDLDAATEWIRGWRKVK